MRISKACVIHNVGRDGPRIGAHVLVVVGDNLAPSAHETSRQDVFFSGAVAEGILRFLRLDVITADGQALTILWSGCRVAVVRSLGTIRIVRLRACPQIFQNRFGLRRDSGIGNGVVEERRLAKAVGVSGRRIVDDDRCSSSSGEAREIATRDGRRRQRSTALIRLTDLPPFIVNHEEELVFSVVKFRNPDGSVKLESVVVPLVGKHSKGLGIVREPIWICIRGVVADEVVHASMIGVGAALADHVDLRCLVTELGRVDTGLNLELLNAVKGRQGDIGYKIRVGIVYAVERVVVPHDSLAADRD